MKDIIIITAIIIVVEPKIFPIIILNDLFSSEIFILLIMVVFGLITSSTVEFIISI